MNGELKKVEKLHFRHKSLTAGDHCISCLNNINIKKYSSRIRAIEIRHKLSF